MKPNMVSRKIREYINDLKRKRIWKSAMFVMSIMTVFCISFVLIRPALTMENDQPTDIKEEETGTYNLEGMTLDEYNRIMILSALLRGTYGDINWEFSPAADGGYKLVLNTAAGKTAAVPSDLFSNSELSEYKNSISAVSLGAGITAVQDDVFSGSEQLRTVEFEDESQLTEIGARAFSDCKQLSSVNLEACTSLTTVGENSFSSTHLAQVTIPGTVTSIGNFAFYNCTNLNTVDFKPNTSLGTMGAFVFAKCTSLESVNLENLTGDNLTFNTNGSVSFEGLTDANGMFYNCSALKSLTLPNMSGSIAAICRGCGSLTNLNLDKCSKLECNNDTGNANFKDFLLGCMAIDELDLSKVTGMTALFPSTLGGGVKKVTLPPTLTKINSNVIKNTGVEEVVFTSQIAYVEREGFRYAGHLKEIDLHFADTGAPYMKPWAFGNCGILEKITISSSLELEFGDNAFSSCKSLKELIWNVKSAKINANYPLVDDATSKNIHFTVGENVEKLSSDMMKKLKDNISEYAFAPNHSFYIDNAVEGTPFTSAGNYYADQNGNLYWLNSSTAPPSAELVYANRSGSGELAIPSELSGVKYYNADGSSTGTFAVKKVCSDAFKKTVYTSISFDNPESITAIADRAFAGAYNLRSINGNTTEETVKALFSNASFGNDVFMDTSIRSDPFSGINSGISVKSVIKNADGTFSHPSFSINDDKLVQISVESKSALPDLRDKCVLATGETANLKIGISNNLSNKKTRVYIKLSDGDSGTVQSTEDIIPLGNGIYYYDVPENTGQAFEKEINIKYPNGASPNKKAYIWLAETTDKFADNQIIYPTQTGTDFTASDKYLEVTWDVLSETYSVDKTTNNNIKPVIKTNGSVHTVENLSFVVSNRMSSRQDNIGADYVNYVTYEDTLTLPAGISWKEELFQPQTEFTSQIHENKHGGTITAEIGGTTYTLCTLNLNTEILRELRYEVKDGNNFKIIWSTENQSKDSEISVADTIISYGSDVLTAKSPQNNYRITNHVDATPCHIYSGTKAPAFAEAFYEVTKGNPDLRIKKEWVKEPAYMGEGAVYKISVDNNSLTEHKGIVEIYDDFGIHQYLTPEIMQDMFTKEEYDGEYLTIEIKNAVLMPIIGAGNEVTAVDGNTTKETSVNNTANHDLYSGLATEYDPNDKKTVSITITKNISGILITSTGNDNILVNESSKYKNIRDALNHLGESENLGYIVTANDQYIAHWDFPDTTVLVGNYHKDYIINATVKNSLQALTEDMNTSIASTSIDYKYKVKNTLKNSNSVEQDTRCDLSISKTAFVDNENKNAEQLADSIRNDKTVICYKLNINHKGTGKYGLLPVVDRMTGVQAVLALKSDNLQPNNVEPEWAEHCDIYTDTATNKEYYVLNAKGSETPVTYNGVYLENAYADSITVTRAEKGLDTLIKWYYIDDTGSEYDIVPTYYAIFSQDHAGNDNTRASYFINNEVWVNDLPTHRIHSSIGAEGTSVAFVKKIVTEKKDDPEADELWNYDLPYPIDCAGKSVTYRLEFFNNGGALSLRGNEFYDVLPETYGFNWSEDDVEISYEVSDTDITVTHGGTDLLEAPGGSEFSVGENIINWNDDFKITFPAGNRKAYIYVTLTFPENKEWLEYVNAKRTEILYNTLYVHDMPSQVSHSLPVTGEAMLRKGVYETGYYVVDGKDGKNRQYFRGTDRFHYIKTPNNAKTVKNTVTYFVVLYNSGDTNLHLSSIYDKLPEGFSFHTLVSTTSRRETEGPVPSSGCIDSLYQGMPNTVGLTYRKDDSYYKRFAVPSAKHDLITWQWEPDWNKQGVVRNHTVNMTGTTTVKNQQMLKFDIIIDEDHKDEIGYFLKPGEAIQFGYMCYTGNADIEEAENICAMEYLDYSLAGLELPENTDLKVSTYNGIYNDNTGGAEIWTNTKADAKDFTSVNDKNLAGEIYGDSSRQWLASSVKLTEEGIVPDITKDVYEEKHSVKRDTPAIWWIKSENNGKNAMTGYTIEDVMQSPFVFTGKVKYNIYSNKANIEHYKKDLSCKYVAGSGTQDDDYLFTISSMDNTGVTVISNKNTTTSFTYGNEQEITVSVKRANGTASDAAINVCFTKNEENATMKIGFMDSAWSIPSDSYSELILQTIAPEIVEVKDGSYYNTAILTPEQAWDSTKKTNGIVSADKKSLSKTASVSIYNHFATASYKEILAENKEGVSANYQNKGGKSDFITIDDKTAEITYALNVSSADTQMGELVFIDTLPQVGDTSPINDAIKRNSEFKVNFADDPDVNVYFVTKNGSETSTKETLSKGTDYSVQYSAKTSGFTNITSDNNSADWTGGGTEWHDSTNLPSTMIMMSSFSRPTHSAIIRMTG